VREVRELVFALDADAAGQQQWRQLARQAALRGKRVTVLESEAYGAPRQTSARMIESLSRCHAGTSSLALPGVVRGRA
jgi:hypothetical protein